MALKVRRTIRCRVGLRPGTSADVRGHLSLICNEAAIISPRYLVGQVIRVNDHGAYAVLGSAAPGTVEPAWPVGWEDPQWKGLTRSGSPRRNIDNVLILSNPGL